MERGTERRCQKGRKKRQLTGGKREVEARRVRVKLEKGTGRATGNRSFFVDRGSDCGDCVYVWFCMGIVVVFGK